MHDNDYVFMSMDSRLVVERILPDGRKAFVSPFHLSLKGLEKAVMCRDDEDYDAAVKYIFITARKCNVIVVIYAVVSNHAHVALLAKGIEDVEHFGIELKRVLSMWLNRKYGEIAVLHGVDVSISAIDTVRYARNVLAYIPRNSLDNGESSVTAYRWSGCRAMFNGLAMLGEHLTKVSSMSTRSMERIFHTGVNLSSTKWLLNERMELEPGSACDREYFERIFNRDESFFLKLLGSVNDYDFRYGQVESKISMSDADFMKSADEYSREWYGMPVDELSLKHKAKFLKYLGMKLYLSVPQVARCMKMERRLVGEILGRIDVNG